MKTPSLSLCALAALALAVRATDLGDDVPRVGELGGPGRVLGVEEMARFLRGRVLFDEDVHRARGLGAPGLNGDSCRACHQDPVLGGAGALELNVSRFGADGGGQGPFQNLPGGQIASRLRPPLVAGREEIDPAADVFEQRQTPALFGGGRIESIPEAAILLNEDPNDLDGDGVRGVARRIPVGGRMEIGRFGWKAQVPRLEDFVRDALGNEMGITTPEDGRGFALASDGDAVPDPEFSEEEVGDMTFFLQELGPPLRRSPNAPAVLEGEEVFRRVGCATCHVPSLPGSDGPVHLYSDLLLHDVMGPGFRGMAEPGAPAGHYRTPPLWGLRFTEPYLHDGRAETVEDAILGHAGEALASRQAFEALPAESRERLLRFLFTL